MAQLMVHDMKDEHTSRQQKMRQEKRSKREEYGIGWDACCIPRNENPATKLAMRQVPEGLVCLVADEEAKSIRVASTTEPAKAVNLEYLSIALQVRRLEGHEPIFSLDPTDATDTNSMQQKVFVPEWLAGTSVGEVLFQADYHLKELSMGEYDQPVVGMKSCFDYSEIDGQDFKEWSAREWFLVRKAEVQIEENTLIPYVKMGVEAREQVIGGKGLHDKLITRPDHPMVKYAEAFTKNFDLIAERKSVIYHLRELAKASVLAKHMLDAEIQLEESWFQLAAEQDLACSLEVPQLWNERFYSKVQLKDGSIVRDRGQKNSKRHGVFGGVAFGLDKFNLSASVLRTAPLSAASGRLAAPTTSFRAPAVPSLGADVAPLAASISAAKFNLATSVARQTAAPATSPIGAAPLTTGAPLAATISIGKLPVPARVAPSLATSVSLQVPTAASVAPGKPTLAAASLDKFDLSAAPSRAGIPIGPKPTLATTVAREANIPVSVPQQRVTFGLSRKAVVAPVQAVTSLATGAAFAPPSGVISAVPEKATRAIVGPRPLAAEAAPRLQGVDLRLDSFDLSSAKPVSLEAKGGTWTCETKSLDQCETMGNAFWACLDHDSECFAEQDRTLLRAIFNPELSDRRSEGDRFAPPSASYANVAKLRALINEEDKVRQRRKDVFFSKDFVMSNPGSLFPTSWTPSAEVARDSANTSLAKPRTLRARPEFKGEAAAMLLQVLKSSVPVFDRITEEGLRFCIYELGSLEVRTTQDASGVESVGAVFSICSASPIAGEHENGKQHLQAKEKINKVTEYVESECAQIGNAIFACQYFVVLETDHGDKILVEFSKTGTAIWNERPTNLEDRRSLAKVTRAVEKGAGVTVGEMRAQYSSVATHMQQAGKTSVSSRKRFARVMFNRATKSNKQR
jgi:hypothetical protein